ncbi:hypothetical protein PENTCL1PPCAC_2821, partial [Pristionchus entomophagus]
ENSSPLDSPLSRNNSGTTYDRAKVARKFSSSPPRPRNGSLSSNITTPHSAQQIRRAKTCRIKDRSSARRTVCSVTGLTIHQKALLTRKWNRMDKSTIHELGRRVFEGVFEESPNALIYIGLKDEPNWKTSITFRMHVQRFVCALTETMRRMKEPNSACDILRDFGAGYVQEREKKRVPATFFEKLANALNDAARQLQESDHLTIERARSVSADDPSESSSEGGGKSDTMTSSTTVLSDQFRPSICSPVGMSNTYSSPSFLQRSDGSDRHPSSSSSSSPICPITSEAWLVFAVFVANQIKFGYELERVLQGEMSKLGLSNVPKKSFIESQHSTEIALFN